jgi:hypothetical protein
MMKISPWLVLGIALLFPGSAFLQNFSLNQQMLEQAKKSACYPKQGDNLVSELKKIDDIANGYFFIKYAIAGCGCTCNNTLGAYKRASGDYVILSNEYGECNYSNGIRANIPLAEFLPDSFGLQTFYQDTVGQVNNAYPALFYIDVSIPRRGTETILTLKLLPMGIKNFCEGGLCYTIQQNETFTNMDYFGDYMDLVKNLADVNSLKYLKNGQVKKLKPEDKKNLDAAMSLSEERNGEMSRMGSYDEVKKSFQYFYYVYGWYKKLAYTILVMDWDAEKGKFYIKEKKGKPTPQTFLQFLSNYDNYWHIMC